MGCFIFVHGIAGPSMRIDCAALVFPLPLPQGRFQSKQRVRATQVLPSSFLLWWAFVSKLPSPSQQKKVKLSFHLLIVCFELFPRIELGTSSLPRKCSTTELKQHLLPKSEAKVRQVFLFCNFFEHFFKKSFYPLQNSPAKGPTNNYKLRGVATQMENWKLTDPSVASRHLP